MIIESISELELYVNQLKLQNKHKSYVDHDELIKDLKYEFNITTTKEQLAKIYTPDLDESILDLQLIYKNVFE